MDIGKATHLFCRAKYGMEFTTSWLLVLTIQTGQFLPPKDSCSELATMWVGFVSSSLALS